MHGHLHVSIAVKLRQQGDGQRLVQQAHDAPKAEVQELVVDSPNSKVILRVTRGARSERDFVMTPTDLRFDGGACRLGAPPTLHPHRSGCHVVVELALAQWALLEQQLLADAWDMQSEYHGAEVGQVQPIRLLAVGGGA